MFAQSLFVNVKNVFAPPRLPRKSLDDYTAESVFRSARFVVGTVEGPRVVPAELISSDALVDEMDKLVGGAGAPGRESPTRDLVRYASDQGFNVGADPTQRG